MTGGLPQEPMSAEEFERERAKIIRAMYRPGWIKRARDFIALASDQASTRQHKSNLNEESP